jgi:predicted signal transduction protein with EAL and GGDEF domain
MPYTVNLSRIDFDNKDLFEKVIKIFEKYKVPQSAVHLEVTESVLLHNTEGFIKLFEQFRDAGFEIWMDDFGSGYASLNVLKDYDFNLVKIDMKFLKNMSERSKKIISSVVNMSKTLGMHTLVEGVETHEQVAFLREIGCEMMQGYYFSRPVNEKDFFEMLEDGRNTVEIFEKRQYISAAGMINTLSPDPLNEYYRCVLNNGSFAMASHSRYPLALLEETEGVFKFIYYNEAYKHELSLLDFLI